MGPGTPGDPEMEDFHGEVAGFGCLEKGPLTLGSDWSVAALVLLGALALAAG